MAEWDDVSSPAPESQPNNSWDTVSSSVSLKVPDTSGVQKMAQQNLSAPKEGESENTQPQTPAQRLDTAAGIPVSNAMKGGDVPLSSDMRGHISDMYKNGTATNAGDAMQSILPAIANAASAAPEPSYKDVVQQAFIRGFKSNIAASIQSGQAISGNEPLSFSEEINPKDQYSKYITEPYHLGWPDFKKIIGKTVYGLTESAPEIVGGAGGGSAGVAAVGGPEDPLAVVSGPLGAGIGAAGVHAVKSLAPTYAEELKASDGDQEKAWAATKTKVGIGSTATGVSFALFGYAPFENAVKNLMFQAFGVQPTVGAGGQIAQNIAEGKPAVEGAGQAAVESGAGVAIPLSAHLLMKTAVGAIPGHEALKETVSAATGKPAQDVTPDDINQTIADGFKSHPAAKDFEDAATVLSQAAYHGTPHSFDNFSLEHAGTGEGNMAVAYGHYLTSEEANAREYQERLSSEQGKPGTGNVYQANIPTDDSLLHWEKPISEQPQKIQDALKEADYDKSAATGAAIYASLAAKLGGKKAASEYLDSLGISGVKYPADMQKGAQGEAGHNYVIFSDKSVQKVQPPEITDALHEIWKQTGVKPDQVFEDAKNNPQIMQDIAAGKFPEAYDLLRDKRPPIPDDVKAAMDRYQASKTSEAKEGIIPSPDETEQSKEGASVSSNPLSRIFNPTGMSEASRDMATALRQGRGPETRDVAVIQDALQKYAKTFANMADEDRLKLIDYMENRTSGAKIHEPELQEAADKIRDIYAQMAEKIQQQFPDVGLRQDYFTHQYKDPLAAEKFFSDWVAKQGSERNLKARAFPTLAEAIKAGLEPRTTNPIETVMNYVTNMGNLIAAHRGVELAQEAGIADYFKNGQQPEGWVPLNGNLAEKGGKTLYAPEDAARVYNNDVSEGMTGEAGNILDNIQRVNNFTNKMVLGLSGYHFTVTTMSSMASDVGRAITSGTIPERAADLLSAVTPLKNTLGGQKIVDAYLGRGDLSPEMQKALDLAIKNNTINVKQQDYWKAGPAKDYVDVFKNGSATAELEAAKQTIKEQPVLGPVKVIANELGRTMDTIAKPLFDYYIPRIKVSANIEELHDWLQDHPEATPQEQDRAAQDIGNSIDNRFGEMMRDNLFWHKITQQTLQTALLSYSWVAGAARMLKGIPDAAQFIMDKQELSSSARYLFGMAATYAVVNGVRTAIGTGQAPDDWKDFLYPRTGGTTPQGKDERELLPSHIGQFTNYLHEGIGELGNEASPGLKLIYHLIADKDWRGLPITNENNSWFSEQRWDDYLKYTLGEETPIGIKNFLQGDKKGSKIGIMEKIFGARQAPRFVSDPEGYESMMKHVNDREYQKKLHSDKKMQEQYENSDENP